jgi:cell division protein FtsI (penicillin-binding protein 3)
VVERGTAKAGAGPGYTVAGKTGTAAKLVERALLEVDYNASFVGFLPSRRPAVSILVVIDSPRGRGIYGGAVAAPVFKRVAEATMRHLGIAPDRLPSPRASSPSAESRRPSWPRRPHARRRSSSPAPAGRRGAG